MRLLVVVTVLVASGSTTFDHILLKYLERCGNNLPALVDDDHRVEDESWFIWMPGSEKVEDPDDEEKNNEYPVIIRSSTEEVIMNPLKYYSDDLVPTIPGDNSHYVEGQSRYIWMPDGNGAPHLVDLQELGDEGLEERSVADTEYWLFTRRNPYIPQEIIIHQANSIRNSNFMRSRPIKVIVHGWLSDGLDAFNSQMKSTFFAVQDVNIIVVDWKNLAKTGYGTSVQAVPQVGQHVAAFLTWLIETSGASWDNVHLLGFSLGAHIAGSAGRFAGGKPSRVTGLDPAGPLFHGNPENISPIDAQYVEIIHTDGDRLGHFGRLGQADFYVNGGRNPQPGCFISTCSHSRVVDLFAATVRFNHLSGHRCKNITEAESVECSGREMKMGNALLNKRGTGIYSVKTSSIWPY